MTELPPVQYLDEAARLAGYSSWDRVQCHAAASTRTSVRAHARTLHRIAELEAKLPKETLEDVARREAAIYAPGGCLTFARGFLRAAEMARKGELPDE